MRLEFEPLDKSTSYTFLEYFAATLRVTRKQYSAHGEINAEGLFVTKIPYVTTKDNIKYDWLILQTLEGCIQEIHIQSETEITAFIEVEAYKFLNKILQQINTKPTLKCFYRFYVRAQFFTNLCGEYWFNSFRFAPLFPDDSTALSERIFVIDQDIEVVEKGLGLQIAKTKVKTYASILSFILNIPITEPRKETLYIEPSTSNPEFKPNTKFSTGFKDTTGLSQMPKKGELAPPGTYEGDLEICNLYYSGQMLICPKKTRNIINNLNKCDLDTYTRFIASCRLYQLSLIIGDIAPTAKLAYQIASVESLIDKRSELNNFTDFAIKYSKCTKEDTDILYGNIRSAHFHSGVFCMGDHEPFVDFIINPMQMYKLSERIEYSLLIRNIIVGWIDEHLL